MVDWQCRESEGKAKIKGYMSVSDEEAHQRTFRREVRLIYPRLMRDTGQAVAWRFTLGMILNVWAYHALSRIIIRIFFFDIQLLSNIFTLCLVV